jgi:hypothetical protein
MGGVKIMDLGAYTQIENLDKIAKENGIEVPRLRGYRLMKDEKPIDINEVIQERNVEANCCIDLCECFWNPNAGWSECSTETKELCSKYVINYDQRWEENSNMSVRWDLLTPEQTEILVRQIKKKMKDITKQFKMWNKYAGKEDILYIHSRIGGGNWRPYDGPKLRKQSWFLGKVDDAYDCTYCDIYARIKV